MLDAATCSAEGKGQSLRSSPSTGPQKCSMKRFVMLRAASHDTCCPTMLVTSERNGSSLCPSAPRKGRHGTRSARRAKRGSAADRCASALGRCTAGGGVCRASAGIVPSFFPALGLGLGGVSGPAALASFAEVPDTLRRFAGFAGVARAPWLPEVGTTSEAPAAAATTRAERLVVRTAAMAVRGRARSRSMWWSSRTALGAAKACVHDAESG